MIRTSTRIVLCTLAASSACSRDDATTGASTASEGGSSSSSSADATTAASASEGVSSDAGPVDTSAGEGTTGDPGGLDPDAIDRIHQAVADTLGTGYATGCSVAIWRDGEVIYTEGFGTRDEAGAPVTPATVFQIGSDTKKMTAIALLRHVDAGDVTLDTSVSDVLPELDLASAPGLLAEITIHELLSHQSGLFEYTPWDDAPDDAELALRTNTAFAAGEYAMMPSSVAWNYSNPNFSLAGLLTETLAGRPWADVVIDDVARPLGMAHTWARRDDVLAHEADVASGFGPLPDSDFDTFDLFEQLAVSATGVGWTTPEAQADNAFSRPAGLVWSTAHDMARLAGFLVDGGGDVLSDDLRAAMQTGQVAMAPAIAAADAGYGYGVVSLRGFSGPQGFRDVRLLQHGGNTIDMSSTFLALPEQSVAVAILSNGANDDMRLLAAVAIEEAAAGRLPDPIDPIDPIDPLLPPADDLSPYAGDFADHALGSVRVTWSGEQLTIDVPLLAELGIAYDPALAPAYRDIFLLTVAGQPFDLSYYPAVLGTPDAYVVNRSFVLGRAPAAAPGPRVWPRGKAIAGQLRPLSLPRWHGCAAPHPCR